MKSFHIIITIILMSSVQLFEVSAGESGRPQSDFIAKPNEAVFEVHGVVCSFCSVGLQKKLSKLPFVDRSRYKKGVYVEIKKQKVTLATKADAEVDMKSVYKAIKSGGYDLTRAVVANGDGILTHFNKEGEIWTPQN